MLFVCVKVSRRLYPCNDCRYRQPSCHRNQHNLPDNGSADGGILPSLLGRVKVGRNVALARTRTLELPPQSTRRHEINANTSWSEERKQKIRYDLGRKSHAWLYFDSCAEVQRWAKLRIERGHQLLQLRQRDQRLCASDVGDASRGDQLEGRRHVGGVSLAEQVGAVLKEGRRPDGNGSQQSGSPPFRRHPKRM
jgi:hypothetical protein